MERIKKVLYWMEIVLKNAMYGAEGGLLAITLLGKPVGVVIGAMCVLVGLWAAWIAVVLWNLVHKNF